MWHGTVWSCHWDGTELIITYPDGVSLICVTWWEGRDESCALILTHQSHVAPIPGGDDVIMARSKEQARSEVQPLITAHDVAWTRGDSDQGQRTRRRMHPRCMHPRRMHPRCMHPGCMQFSWCWDTTGRALEAVRHTVRPASLGPITSLCIQVLDPDPNLQGACQRLRESEARRSMRR